MGYYAVTTVHGPNWDASRSIREQQAWDDHAAFMDRLVDDGFVVLGGPLGNGERALLIVESEGEDQIERRMADDPWRPMGMLEVGTIEPWTIWLDGRSTRASTA